jgi:hypothetical protein
MNCIGWFNLRWERPSPAPGVSSTYHGPGASRPVIRGLSGDRVRVLDDGVGTLDAASVSPDRNTAIEPLFASSIEVLRGPSTLLYGSSAVRRCGECDQQRYSHFAAGWRCPRCRRA